MTEPCGTPLRTLLVPDLTPLILRQRINCPRMNVACPPLIRRNVLPGSLGGHLQLFYAHAAVWERPSLCPYKLAPPLFQTGMYYPPQTKVHQPKSLKQALYRLHFSYTGCFWLIKALPIWVRKDKQTNIHT